MEGMCWKLMKQIYDNIELYRVLTEKREAMSATSRKLFDSFSFDNGTRVSVNNGIITAIKYNKTGRWEQLDILPDGTCILNICLYGGF